VSSEDKKLEVLSLAYEHAMERINGQQAGFRRLANNVLIWITCAKRPLTTSELQQALAVEVGKLQLDNDNLTEIEEMVSVCVGLVTVDKESHVIRLVHYTTQEYLERTHERWFPDAESEITKICITYLSFNSFNTGFCTTDEQFEVRIRENALYRYAAKNWGHHARAASTAADQPILHFLEMEIKLTACTQAMLASEQYSWQSRYSQKFPRHMIGVHFAAYFGLEKTLASLIQNEYDLDVRDTYNQTPLSWAAKQGHTAVVRLLLERGPELEVKNNHQGETPLSLAAKHGHEAVVHQLLDQGAKVESNGKNSSTPLSLAAWKGHEAVVRLLLEWDAKADSKDASGNTPLSLAARNGYEAIVRLLVEQDAKVDSENIEGYTPLSLSVMYGYEPVVRLLLERDAKVDSKDTSGHTPLSLAARNGYETIVRLLLEHGAELGSRDRTGRTPLSYASENGHEKAVKLLLEKAVDLDSRDKDIYYGRTPLLWAAWNGQEAIIMLLLENAIDVDTKDQYGQTALSYVAWHGLEAAVRLLLEKAVDVDSKDIYYGRTPLSYASENGHEVVVNLLLGNTVDIQSMSNSGRTPLVYAKENGQEAVVKLLQEKAVDVDSNSNSDSDWIQLLCVTGNRGKTDNTPKKACGSFNRYGADIDH
jgi:ankyrin repeat protein